MAIASLIFGIFSLEIAIAGGVTGTGWIGLCGIVAVILGSISKKNPEQKTLATAGLICGFIAMSLGIIAIIASITA